MYKHLIWTQKGSEWVGPAIRVQKTSPEDLLNTISQISENCLNTSGFKAIDQS